jgi:hypothetical protein
VKQMKGWRIVLSQLMVLIASDILIIAESRRFIHVSAQNAEIPEEPDSMTSFYYFDMAGTLQALEQPVG